MLLSYSSFKSDILSFQTEEYIKNLDDPTSYNSFVDFIEIYKDIENEDFKKPIFSQTTKFKKIPNNFKNFKYQKINRDNEEQHPAQFTFEDPSNENEKIAFLIRTHLNKISKDTYKKISLEFINDLAEIKNTELFEILSIEILKKCLFDNKYRNLYINLCYKIWSNKQIHNNLINVIIKDSKYFWTLIPGQIIGQQENDLNGPFTSEIFCKNDAYSKLNFKKYFLNHIQKLYIKKEVNFTNLSEEDEFIKKKEVLLLVELIAIMYLEKYIKFDIINIIIIDLLHITNSFVPVTEIEIEALYSLIKKVRENKLNMSNQFIEYKIIFGEFTDIITGMISSDNTKRSDFFLRELVTMLNELINISSKSMKSVLENAIVQPDSKTNIEYEIILLDKLSDWNIEELYCIFNKVPSVELMYKLIDKSISGKIIHPHLYKLLNKIGNGESLLNNTISKFVENIEDISLDIPDIADKLLKIIETCELDKKFITKINEFCNDDSDFYSDDKSDDEDNDKSDESEED